MGSVDDFYHAMIPYENRHRKNKKISQKEMEAYEEVIFLNLLNIGRNDINKMSPNQIHANLFNIILEYRNLFKIMIDFRQKNKIDDDIKEWKDRSVGEILNHNFLQKSVMNKKINGKTYKEILVMFLTQIYTRWSTLQNTLVIRCQNVFYKLKNIKPNNEHLQKLNKDFLKNCEEDGTINMNNYCRDVIDFVSSKIDKLKNTDNHVEFLSKLKVWNIPKRADSSGVKSLKDFDLDKILELPEI